MASNKTQLMAQFYEQCKNKGYTNMRDATQSLKAKVIATDLGLRYGNIVEFYEKAAQCYQQVQDENAREAERLRIQKQEEQAENARRAVNGALLVTISDSKTTLKVYLRPDGTTYCTVNDGGKIEGIPSLSVHKGGSLQYTYHPSETVFTGASSGGIMMGGTHQTEAYYSERVSKSGKGYIKATIGGTEVSVTLVTMSEYTQACFKRDEQFKRLVSNGKIRCTKDSEMANILARSALSGGGNIYMQMSQLTMAADEKRLPYETCKDITDLVGRIIYGHFPPSDEELYARAKKLAEGETSEQLMRAIETFRKISDYKDASKQIKRVQEKYEEVLQAEKEQAILEREARNRRIRRCSVVVCAVLFALTLTFAIISVISKNSAYDNAVALMDAGNYEEALAAFAVMDGYKDSEEQIKECEAAIVAAEEARIAAEKARIAEEKARIEAEIAAQKEADYAAAEKLLDSGRFDDAYAAFEAMGDYRDSVSKLSETRYRQGVKLLSDGDCMQAIEIFLTLGDYSDSGEKIKEAQKNIIQTAQKGDVVFWGKYEQDGVSDNGGELIRWIVLDKSGNKLVLISEKILDRQIYDTDNSSNWTNSALYEWLNQDFYNEAFSNEEQNMLHSTAAGKVYILSREEISRYFNVPMAHKEQFCYYEELKAKSADVLKRTGVTSWWTRTPGEDYSKNHVKCISGSGLITDGWVGYYSGVRPVITVNIP